MLRTLQHGVIPYITGPSGVTELPWECPVPLLIGLLRTLHDGSLHRITQPTPSLPNSPIQVSNCLALYEIGNSEPNMMSFVKQSSFVVQISTAYDVGLGHYCQANMSERTGDLSYKQAEVLRKVKSKDSTLWFLFSVGLDYRKNIFSDSDSSDRNKTRKMLLDQKHSSC